MAVESLSEEKFDETSGRHGMVLVDCWAKWCGACNEFAPVFERIAKKFPHHTFAKLNTETEKKVVREMNIKHIPTLMLFRDGILLLQRPGYLDEAGLIDVIEQAESLDMEEVRRALQAEG
jgi:thioredoxin 1